MKLKQLKIPPYHQKAVINQHDSESEEEEESIDSELAEYEADTPTIKYQIVTFTSCKDFAL